jgi:hypothetical protein
MFKWGKQKSDKPKVTVLGQPEPLRTEPPALAPSSTLVKIRGKEPLQMAPPSKEQPIDSRPRPVIRPGSRTPVLEVRPGLAVTIANEPIGGGYAVSATSWLLPDRRETATLVIPFTPGDLDAILAELSRTVQSPRKAMAATMPVLRGDVPADAADGAGTGSPLIITIGQRLFTALFRGPLEDLYGETVAGATAQFPITIETGTPEVARLPWEFLHDGERFLCTDIGPIYRVVPGAPRTGQEMRLPEPFRLLVVPTNLPGSIAIDVEREIGNITDALRGARCELETPDSQKVGSFMQTLVRFKPHVLHFIGHGDKDGNILFKGDANQSVPVGEVLGQMVGAMGESPPRVIILNACGTARARPEAHDLGLAAKLVRSRVPLVVATQFRISDLAASAFARGFYEYVAAGLPIQRATAWGRLVIKTELGETVEWATPVVYANASVHLG